MSNRFYETYEEWRERVGVMPDQDVREAWEHQQRKIEDLLAVIDEMAKGRLEPSEDSLWTEDS